MQQLLVNMTIVGQIKEILIFKILSENKEKSQKSKRFYFKNRITLSSRIHIKERKGSRKGEGEGNIIRLYRFNHQNTMDKLLWMISGEIRK